MTLIDTINKYKQLKGKGLLTPKEDNERFKLEQHIKDNIIDAILNGYELIYNEGECMYSCIFETESKSNYLLMLSKIDSKGWRRKATGDAWNCIFRIEFDMHS